VKTVLVMRHAKSSWKHDDLPDHERPLNGRGRRDAPRMGRWMVDRGTIPDRILASTAIRAQTTARLAGDDEPETELRPDLYLSGAEAYAAALAALDDGAEVAMIVGHNPDVEDLIARWTGESVVMPTAAVAIVRLAVDRWSELGGEATGTLEQHAIPREIDGPGR
jgi:phosphohistidine phosphatase